MSEAGQHTMKANELLIDEILRLPFEKIGKALSFIRYLEQEAEEEIILIDSEYKEFCSRLDSDDFITDDELLVKIERLNSDQIP